MTAAVLDMSEETQWMADLTADDARAAVRRTLELAQAIAAGKLGDVGAGQAAYLIRVAVFDSARGTAPESNG